MISPNNQNSTFTISWDVDQYANAISPALYIVQIKTEDFDICHKVYILRCRSCNQIYKEVIFLY